MAEITDADIGDVETLLKKNFGAGELARDYAEIAGFLSDNKAWMAELEKVSEILEDQYGVETICSRGNRLTGAITAAAEYLGFTPYSGVILAGFTSEETFKDYVRKGAFWKDAVSSNHGEHSHSLQWLAIGHAVHVSRTLKLTYKVKYLYGKTVDFKSSIPFFHSGRGEDANIYLWDFLVDCFDFGSKAPDYKTNIHTRTGRSPTFVNKQIFQSKTWIGDHLNGRYKQRGWGDPGTSTPIKQHAIDAADRKKYKQTASNTGGNYVYERPLITKSSKVDVPAGRRKATLVVKAPAWGLKGANSASVEWTSRIGKPVTLPLDGACPQDKPGRYPVEVEIVRSGGCLARIVG